MHNVRPLILLTAFILCGCGGSVGIGSSENTDDDGGALCPPNMISCSDRCVDTNTDRANCGACDTACDDGEVCNGSGQCELSCQVGLTECNAECVNLLTDNRYCSDTGVCGNPCPVGQICAGAGLCVISCSEVGSQIPGGCVFDMTSTCACVGCVNDRVCAGNDDDCVCGDCDTNPWCITHCVNDGLCDPWNEGCACADCTWHPECT